MLKKPVGSTDTQSAEDTSESMLMSLEGVVGSFLAVFNFEAVTNRVRTLILGAGSLPLYGPADYSMKTVSILTVTSQRPLSKEGVSQAVPQAAQMTREAVKVLLTALHISSHLEHSLESIPHRWVSSNKPNLRLRSQELSCKWEWIRIQKDSVDFHGAML